MEELELLIRQSVCSVVADIIVCMFLLLVWTTLVVVAIAISLAIQVAVVSFLIVALSGVVSLSKILKSFHIPGLMLVIIVTS